MSDGTVIDTARIRHVWVERRDDGFGRASGSQWGYQQLCESLKGRYYLWYYSNWQGSRDHLEWIEPQEATRWLILNEYELPVEGNKMGSMNGFFCERCGLPVRTKCANCKLELCDECIRVAIPYLDLDLCEDCAEEAMQIRKEQIRAGRPY